MNLIQHYAHVMSRLSPAGVRILTAAGLVFCNWSASAQSLPQNTVDTAKQFENLQQAFENKNYSDAAEGLRSFTRENAGWERIADANRLYGASLVLAGEVSAGRQILDRAIEQAPQAAETASAFYYRGKALEGMGNFPGAILEYNTVWTQFPKHALASQAALNEATLAEKLLDNQKRARDVYERFVKNHAKHPDVPDIMNHLALMAEQEAEFETAVELYKNYALANQNTLGNHAMNGNVAGPGPAMWRAATLANEKLKDPKQAVALYTAYAGLPTADKARGLITAARIAAATPEAGNAEQLFQQALQVAAISEWRLEFAAWLKKQEQIPKANAQLTAVIESTQKPDQLIAALDALGEESTRTYLDKHPTRLSVFQHYLSWFKAPEKRKDGRAILDAWLARTDIEWKTAAARQWSEWTQEYEDLQRVVAAADAEGMIEDSTAASLAAADRLFEIETALASQPPLKIQDDTGAVVGEIQAAVMDQAIAIHVWIADRRATPNLGKWPDTGVELYFSMARDKEIRQIIMSPGGPKAPLQVSFYENGVEIPAIAFDHIFRPRADFGYEIWATVPMTAVKIDLKASKILLEAAARTSLQPNGDTQFVTLFETGLRNAFQNNEFYGQLDLKNGFQDIADEKIAERTTYYSGPSRDVLESSIKAWAPYPDFPRAEFAVRLQKIAELEPLITEQIVEKPVDQPAAAEGDPAQPPPAATEKVKITVMTDTGKAARQQALALIIDHQLHQVPRGRSAAATLAAQIEAENAVNLAIQAVEQLIAAGQRQEAIAHSEFLFKNLPAHDGRLVDLLYKVAAAGENDWKEFYDKTVKPRATQELQHYQNLNPATENSRLAVARLSRFFDAKQSIARHDEYLTQHPAGQDADLVRRQRFLELKRAGQDPAEEIQELVEKLADNPALAKSIPLSLLPAGPKGYDLAVENLENAVPQADNNLKPALLLILARMHQQFGHAAKAMVTAQELMRLYASSSEALKAKELGVDLFSRGFFPPGTTQQQAELAFQWLMELALAGEVRDFSGLTGSAWKLACHPAARLRGFEDFSNLYLFSTHTNIVRATDMAEFLSAMYAAYPADGVGPTETLTNGPSPFRGGPTFMLYRWGFLRAPETGHYNFWFNSDDWAGFEINGRAFNFPAKNSNGHFGIHLTRGLHLLRVAYGDWGGGHSMKVEWQPPGKQRAAIGADAFSADLNPVLMAVATAQNGTFGVAQWDAYLKLFPKDSRAHSMRLETFALANPGQAAGQLQQLVAKYPDNSRYKAMLADCRWRLQQTDQALTDFKALGNLPVTHAWQQSHNRIAQSYFLQGKQPSFGTEEHVDRIRAASAWKQWVQSAAERNGLSGELQARIEAGDHLTTLTHQLAAYKQNIGRITASIAKEEAQIAAAKALAAKEDADEKVKTEAQTAAARSQNRLAELQAFLTNAQRTAATAETELSAFRKAVGISDGQQPLHAAVQFAQGKLAQGVLDTATIYQLSQRAWAAFEAKQTIRPFLVYLVGHSTDAGHIRWATDRLVDLAMAGETPGEALNILTAVGMRAPRDAQHAEWLRRACDLALQSGNVYSFARNAHVLAKLHPDQGKFSTYLDRLGEVFEKAGNYVSAEAEYQRTIDTSSAPAAVRRARLSLAGLYEQQSRSIDALRQLSELTSLAIPAAGEDKRRSARRPLQNGKPEDPQALLMAVRSYLSLELLEPALESYDRAAASPEFGKDIIPDYSLLVDLADAAVKNERNLQPIAKDAGPRGRTALPPAIVARAEKTLELVDAMTRFHEKTMKPHQVVQATLLRADANMLMRNYPRAIEEIRAAKKAAGDSPAALMADLKMGELHLATDNADQALPIFKTLAAMDRRDVSPLALFWLGTAQLHMNNKTQAVESFRVLWEQYAENELVRQAIYTIAKTYAEQGAFLDAIRLYEAVGAMNSLPREKVVPGDILTVKVWDADYYLGTGDHVLPVEIQVPSGDREELGLEMNKINNSLFLGSIRTILGDPVPDDGILQIVGTDMVYVTYQDRFKGLEEGEDITAEALRGDRRTSLIQVAQDSEITVSPQIFVEEEIQQQQGFFAEPSEAEKAEEQRRAALSASLERGEGVIRPGNAVYLRVRDGDYDRTGEPDTILVTAFTYSVEQAKAEVQQRDLAREYQAPLPFEVTDTIPANPAFTKASTLSPAPGDSPRLDSVNVILTETGPHTGIFHGMVRTAVNGPTAIASDHSGNRTAAYAIDGSNKAEDAWQGFIDGQPGKWLEIDMKELHEVSRITWDRGAGADDRYMIDYTVTLRGDGQPVVIEQKDNQSAHDNEILLEKPVHCRWLRFTASKYDGDAPAISEVQVFGTDGRQIIPPEISPLARSTNEILEFNVGDCMAAEVMDDENISPGRPLKRVSNPLGVGFVNGQIDALYISHGSNKVEGSLLLKADTKNKFEAVYGRRTKRVKPDDVLQIMISDSDLDVDSARNKVECEVFSSSGDQATLTAEELRPTAGVFRARIQLSSNPAAKDDANRLWVQPHDVIVMRYKDNENRNPGHSVYRYSAVYVAQDEIAFYPGVDVAISTPSASDDSLLPPHITATLVDPDLAVPGKDAVAVNLLSFATRDQVAVNLLLRDLDGRFSSRIPLQMDEKPDFSQSRGEADTSARRLQSIDEAGRRGRADAADFSRPLAIAGDDILYMTYSDIAPNASAGRVFIPIASTAVLQDVTTLGAPELPDSAEATDSPILLKDPLASQKTHARERQKAVLRDIARKKIHYRRLMASYESSLASVTRRIDALNTAVGTDVSPASAAVAETETAPAPEDSATPIPASPLQEETFAASEELIKAAALRRDRDGLAIAMKTLKQRLDALESSYDTTQLEEQIHAEETDLRAALAAPAATDTPAPDEPEGEMEKPLPWYSENGWWTKCGGIVPGTTLVLHVFDPNITAETVELRLTAVNGRPPQVMTVIAQKVPDQQHTFEARVKTVLDSTDDGVLALSDARYVVASYVDTEQTEFPALCSSFLTLASDATARITGADFLESKEEHHLGEDLYITITDFDMNKTAERDYVWLEVTSDTGDVERVPVRESQPQSGIFRGSIPTRLDQLTEDDGVLSGQFGGSFSMRYVDELWRTEDQRLPPVLELKGSFVPGTDGEVEIFARQLKRGALQRDVLFNTARAEYELGKSSTEMGASERGRRRLLESRDKFSKLIALFPEDPVCAHATYYLGNIHFLLHDVDKAVTSLQYVIDKWPDTEFKSKALYKLGTCYMRTGRMDKAVESFVNLAYHHSDSPLVADAMLTMAQQFSTRKQYDKATGIGKAFIRKFPQHQKAGQMYLRLAGWLMADEHLAVATEVLEEAEKQMPDSPLMPAFLYWHADCLFKTKSARSNDYRRGIVMLQRVKFDYSETKWAKYAAARLTEVDTQ